MTDDAPWTIGRLLTWTTDYLAKHGGDSPRLDAEVLLAHARGSSRIQLYTDFATVASDELREAYRQLVKQRAQGMPVAYLVGHREFYSLDFTVSPDVLIPRPETEFVLVSLFDLVKKHQLRQEPLKIADVGTGSGILAICAARQIPHSHVWAIDASPAALEIARQNVERHAVADRVTLLTGDLTQPLPADVTLDFILSNPPYVSQGEWEELAPEVRDHEPRSALVGGERGDEIIRRLVAEAAQRLTPGGWLILEISPMLQPHVESWFANQGVFEPPVVTKDLAQLPRVVTARRRPDRLSA